MQTRHNVLASQKCPHFTSRLQILVFVFRKYKKAQTWIHSCTHSHLQFSWEKMIASGWDFRTSLLSLSHVFPHVNDSTATAKSSLFAHDDWGEATSLPLLKVLTWSFEDGFNWTMEGLVKLELQWADRLLKSNPTLLVWGGVKGRKEELNWSPSGVCHLAPLAD